MDDWRNDESEYGDQRIKINIMNKIVNAFQTRSPRGGFLFYIGKGTDKRIYEFSEKELYTKISKSSIASDDECEYNYNFLIQRDSPWQFECEH